MASKWQKKKNSWGPLIDIRDVPSFSPVGMRRVMDGIPQGKPCPESLFTEQGLQKAVNDCLSQFSDSFVAKMLPPPPHPA